MEEDDDSDIISVIRLKSDVPRRRAKKIKIPRRAPSVIIPEPKIIVMTAGIKSKPIKLNQCQVTPLTLYELCAARLDQFKFPDPFEWTEEQVADWLAEVVGLPRYRECILNNHVNGRRLLLLEEPSVLPEMNIQDFNHIKMITSAIREIFTTDFELFMRSVGLPIRKPFTHCTFFKSQTGPPWGIRQNWTRSDILRWMKILMPKPLYLDHWDKVWYQNPDFPKVLLARIPKLRKREDIPRYDPPEEYCNEYLTPRRFRLQANIPEESQLIWMEHLPGSPLRREPKDIAKKDAKKKVNVPKESRLFPKRVSLSGLAGKDLILARRKMPTPKFLKS